MTDDGRFLSRRERRAQEEREAARMPADTDALALGPISESIPTHAPDGRMLTRRERRRLERARQPMETWTAEEEMIATGQIPAMTPERIAEQEKLARERAAAAQEEAEAASAELEGVLGHPDISQPGEKPGDDSGQAQEGAHTQGPEMGAEDTPPERTSLIAAVAADASPTETESAPAAPESAAPEPAVSEPAAPEPEPEGAEQAPAEPLEDAPAPGESAPEVATGSEHDEPVRTNLASVDPAPADDAPAMVEEPEPASAPDQPEEPATRRPSAPATFDPPPTAASPAAPVSFEPEPESAPEPEPEPALEPESEPSAPAPVAIPGMPPGMSPEMFAELFPPGSLQRRMIEEQAASEQAEAAPQAEDPAAEIRRLTQEAVAGIDAASVRTSGEPAPYTELTPDNSPVPQADAAPQPSREAPSPIQPIPGFGDDSDAGGHAQPGDQQASAWEEFATTGQSSTPAAPVSEPDSGPPTFSFPAVGPHGATSQEPTASSPVSTEEQPADFEPAQPWATSTNTQAPAPTSPEQAPFDAILGDHSNTATRDDVSSAPGEFPTSATEAPSPWGAHPLSQVDREAPELPEMPPAQGVPQPDLSGIGFRGRPGEYSQVPNVEPVPTGQIEVPQRPRPELSGDDVPRHFKWAHLAVFGAVALLLGVVVWHVTR